ncbi:MAG: ATP-binding protein [Candidatus Eremiobacterota bacterium]
MNFLRCGEDAVAVIDSFSVEGFKSFADPTEVDLGAVNVFVGANGSGKSALLEALGVLSSVASGRVDDGRLSERGVRPGVPILYKSSFRTRKGRPIITLSARAEDELHYRVSLWNPLEELEPASISSLQWKVHSESMTRGKTLVKGLSRSPKSKQLPVDEFTSLLSTVAGRQAYKRYEPLALALDDYCIYCPDTPSLRGIVPDIDVRIPIGLRGGRLPEALLEMFSAPASERISTRFRAYQELLDWVGETLVRTRSEAAVSPSVPTPLRVVVFDDRFMDSKRNRLTAFDASEGALYVCFLAVLALHPRSPRLFAVDNFDHGLHPRLAQRTMELFCRDILKTGRRALMTTHNPLVLDGLDLRNDQLRLFAVERDTDGVSRVRRIVLDPDLLENAKQKGIPLSRLWVTGRLGAVPNL